MQQLQAQVPRVSLQLKISQVMVLSPLALTIQATATDSRALNS